MSPGASDGRRRVVHQIHPRSFADANGDGVPRFGDDGAHRVASATTLATVLHLHRGTPQV